MGFLSQEHWSGLPFPSLGDLPNQGIEPLSPALQAGSLPPSHWGSPCSVLEINARDKVNEGHLSCNREGVEILEK